MRIGILEPGHSPDVLREEFGDYADFFETLLGGAGMSFTRYDVEGGILPKSATEADGWLITGSRHGVYEDHIWIDPLMQFIRDIAAAQRPLVGICFGHQIIAQALGGHVEKFDGGWAVGRQTYDSASGPVALNAWHQDQVISPPAGAKTILANAFCRYAGLQYGHQTLTFQPHPEFSSQFTGALAQARGRGVVPDDLLQQVHANLSKPIDDAKIGQQIVDFFRRSAQHV